jgi:uncharacterized protein
VQLMRYNSAAAWLARTQATLEQEEAKNSLQVGVAVRLAEHPNHLKVPPYLATVEDQEGLAAAAVMTPPHRVIVSSQRGVEPTSLSLIVDDLLAGGWSPPGVVAESSVALTFARLWAERTSQPYRPGMSQRIYELRRVIPPAPVPGAFRTATEDDLDLVSEWVDGFIVDARLPRSTPGESRALAAMRIAGRDICVWETDGRPVSMAGRTRHSSRGIAVSLVYTPKELRRRGYASACVAALSQRLLDAGWEFCTLYTDLSNPTSNAIYQQIGYVPVCDSNEYDFVISGEEPS